MMELKHNTSTGHHQFQDHHHFNIVRITLIDMEGNEQEHNIFKKTKCKGFIVAYILRSAFTYYRKGFSKFIYNHCWIRNTKFIYNHCWIRNTNTYHKI